MKGTMKRYTIGWGCPNWDEALTEYSNKKEALKGFSDARKAVEMIVSQSNTLKSHPQDASNILVSLYDTVLNQEIKSAPLFQKTLKAYRK